MSALFAYGSLMCQDIIQTVANVRLDSIKGIVTGVRRLEIKNELYPGLVMQKDEVVDGVVYFDISPEIWLRLDRFEGEMYRREMVEVKLEEGHKIRAYTYFVKDEYKNKLTDIDWDFKKFLKNSKKAFISTYIGYERTQ